MDALTNSVSVIIPAYACAGSLPKVLDALLNQTLPPQEIIVVNDQSPDDLEASIAPYQERIIYIKNPTNKGLARTCNVGLQRATGDYLMTLHSDCVLDPRYIETLLDTLQSRPDAAAVTGQYRFENFHKLSLPDQLFAAFNALPVDQGPHLNAVEEIGFLEGKADLFRGALLREVGFFNEKLILTAEDQDLSVRLRQRGFRIFQCLSCHFTVCFSATQDSLKKVLRKQYTYARGQAYILLKHGTGSLKPGNKNRDHRALHRSSQIGSALLLWLLLLLAPRSKTIRWTIVILYILRVGHYASLAKSLAPRNRLLAACLGPVCDSLYTAGLIEGATKTITRKEDI